MQEGPDKGWTDNLNPNTGPRPQRITPHRCPEQKCSRCAFSFIFLSSIKWTSQDLKAPSDHRGRAGAPSATETHSGSLSRLASSVSPYKKTSKWKRWKMQLNPLFFNPMTTLRVNVNIWWSLLTICSHFEDICWNESHLGYFLGSQGQHGEEVFDLSWVRWCAGGAMSIMSSEERLCDLWEQLQFSSVMAALSSEDTLICSSKGHLEY